MNTRELIDASASDLHSHVEKLTAAKDRPAPQVVTYTKKNGESFPGETIATEMWKDGDVVSFRSRVVERDIVVLNNGRAEIS